MPELPEVETIRRGLTCQVEGRQIVAVDIRLPRLITGQTAEEFIERVVGRRILLLDRRGKYLLFRLEDDMTLVIHLRMTGRLYCRKPNDAPDSYARLIFDLDNGDRLVFADVRTLGTLSALRSEELGIIHGLATMGPEPLSTEFTIDYLTQVLASRKGKIKSLLLDQQIIGGLGNIYVDESLAMAGIHPERTGASISHEELSKLHQAINAVIHEALSHKGTTFRDYRDSYGKSGGHQQHLRVYGRKGEICETCGERIVRTEVGGRGTHFCPNCQR